MALTKADMNQLERAGLREGLEIAREESLQLQTRLWRAETALLNASMGVMEPVAQYMRDYPEPVERPCNA